MPPQHDELTLDGTITAADYARIARGYVPRGPQDRWFLYVADGWLHVHRSATGACIYQLELLAHDDHFVAPRLRVNRDPAQYRSDDAQFDVEMVAYLIDRYLFGRTNLPVPLPHGVHQRHRDTHARHVLGSAENKPLGGGFIDLSAIGGGDG